MGASGGKKMPEWDIRIKATRLKQDGTPNDSMPSVPMEYRIEGEKDAARAKALERAMLDDGPTDYGTEYEVDDQREVF